jgi:hypothetical protein
VSPFKRTIRRLNEDGTTVTETDLGPNAVSVFVANGSALNELPGTRTTTTYTVSGVPTGPWIAHFGTGYYVTSGDTLDLGYDGLGRMDVENIDAGVATLALDVSGLPAWGNGDDLQFLSPGADFYGYGTYGAQTEPTVGVVPSHLEYDYGSLALDTTAPRVDARRGDSLYAVFMQHRELIAPTQRPDGGSSFSPFFCGWATAAAKLTSVTINPGRNAVTAPFVTAPTVTLGLIYPRTQWAARSVEAHPSAVMSTEELYFVSEPVKRGVSGDLLQCVNNPFPNEVFVDVNRSITTGNPFPASWPLRGSVTSTYRMRKTVADAGTWTATARSSVSARAGDPLAPGVHPPRQVLVQGMGADQVETVVAASPLSVSWTPSTQSPQASAYVVNVVQMVRDAGGVTYRSTVAFARTGATSFTFPPGTLQLGQMYQLRVGALETASPEGTPNSQAASSTAEAMSNPFRAQ